ncbi:MAG TPA: choice-of-anchor tandem repeat GloVer-containing protein [Rhizomicrobium sp.]|jgi:uncharacterized repeat protein (TIGR03803 family)
MPKIQNLARLLFVACLASAVSVMPQAAAAKRFTIVHRFLPSEAKYPSGGLIADAAGNLYGVTRGGGIKNKRCRHSGPGCGVVYRIAADGTFSQLYAFQGDTDGFAPYGNLLLDGGGNLYGTTMEGGAFSDSGGTVFKIAADGTKTTLHSFGSSGDGAIPLAGLIADSAGNLYGTTDGGGPNGGAGGTVFRIAPGGTETVLYSFCALANCADGQGPRARLLLDGTGDLYGTTEEGGVFNKGTVFKLANNGVFSVVYSFGAQPNDGSQPRAGLIADTAGNLYGDTAFGGHNNSGTLFRIAPNGSETILYDGFSFDGPNGLDPEAELLLDGQGNLFGTAGYTLFRLRPNGNFKVLHTFNDRDPDPVGQLLPLNGYLYGVTEGGSRRESCCGVVYSLNP